MALMPSHQFYPRTTSFIDSFQSSVNKLHVVTTRLQFFRYGYSIPFKNQILCVSNESTISSDSTPQQNPQKRSNFGGERRDRRWDSANEATLSKSNAGSVSLSSNSWLNKWNESSKQNKLKGPQVVVDYRNGGEGSDSDCEESNTGSTMERIVVKLKKFGYVDDTTEKKEEERVIEKGSIEDIFYVEEGILPNARGGFSKKSPFGDENAFSRNGKVTFPWEKPEVKEEENKYSVRQKPKISLAELTLPESELRRLKILTLQIKNKMKIGGSGVTGEVVEKIHEKWKSSEVVRLKIEGPPALNMRRIHEILERKTGGLAIWRSGTSIALYRGVGYKVPSERFNKHPIYNKNDIPHEPSSLSADASSNQLSEEKSSSNIHKPDSDTENAGKDNTDVEPLPEVKYEDEVDKLLNGLGPRYTDWPGAGPLPVDADLLPGFVPGYKPPFRILPYGVRPSLGLKEATALRRLSRVLPPHFALGRSRQHQGLAAAMVKLWERSSVAKIALKRGVQLTTSERMAEEIKKLTGGILLSRNKDFLVFYRGKDFLSPDVAEALLEKERLAKTLQDEEEQARLRASASVTFGVKITDESGTAGTLGETLDADARWGKKLDQNHKEKVMREAEILRHANLVRKLEKKLAFAERRIMRAERALSKVEESLNPAKQATDPDSITDDERFMFRKLGLRMKAFLLLGRRGVFDGTVENMHLHWKYRELIKIIVKAKNFEQVKSIALSLESESGGVLVSVDKVSKGYAVIVFRGKNYKRPPSLRPKNLLTKRKALARSIELQRHEALLKHISNLQSRVGQLRSEIEQMSRVSKHGDEELYNRLDSVYPTEDEDSEDEGEVDDAHLETYDNKNDLSDESDELTNDHHFKSFAFDTEDTSETEHVLS